MKTISKISLIKIPIIILFMISMVASCNKDGEMSDYLTISPTSGQKNTLVTIEGDGINFGLSDTAQVYFNNVEATVISVTESKIIAKVPTRSFTGPVTITIDGKELIAPTFTYLLSDINVSTIAGSTNGIANLNGIDAKFYTPFDIAIDTNGNIFVADSGNNLIRKIAPNGDVTTLAGSTTGFTDGNNGAAQFNSPRGITTDNQGNVYVVDANNHSIRKITPTGNVTTFAGTSGTAGNTDGAANIAKFNSPESITIDSQGNLFVADKGNHRIRKITPAGIVSTFAGSTSGYADGAGTDAKFYNPYGLDIDSSDNIYVADLVNHRIRKITPDAVVTTVAGVGSPTGYLDGEVNIAKFNYPIDLAVDELGNIFVSDLFNHKIRRISPEGMVSTIAGDSFGFNDGLGSEAKFKNLAGLETGKNGVLYIADRGNHKIRKLIIE